MTGGADLCVGDSRTGWGSGSGAGGAAVPALCDGARSGLAAAATPVSASVTSVTLVTKISLNLRGCKTNLPRRPIPLRPHFAPTRQTTAEWRTCARLNARGYPGSRCDSTRPQTDRCEQQQSECECRDSREGGFGRGALAMRRRGPGDEIVAGAARRPSTCHEPDEIRPRSALVVGPCRQDREACDRHHRCGDRRSAVGAEPIGVRAADRCSPMPVSVPTDPRAARRCGPSGCRRRSDRNCERGLRRDDPRTRGRGAEDRWVSDRDPWAQQRDGDRSAQPQDPDQRDHHRAGVSRRRCRRRVGRLRQGRYDHLVALRGRLLLRRVRAPCQAADLKLPDELVDDADAVVTGVVASATPCATTCTAVFDCEACCVWWVSVQ